MSVIFSDFLLSNEISGCTEHKSNLIFFVHALFLPYNPIKIYRIDMDHPVGIWVAQCAFVKLKRSTSGNAAQECPKCTTMLCFTTTMLCLEEWEARQGVPSLSTSITQVLWPEHFFKLLISLAKIWEKIVEKGLKLYKKVKIYVLKSIIYKKIHKYLGGGQNLP